MAPPSAHYYWDTCIFVAYLNDNKAAYGHHVDHIAQFLDECRRGECRIYTSSITIAEIPPKRMTNSKYGTFNDFLADYTGAIVQIGADPNVMMLAAELKNPTYRKDPKAPKGREIGTPDAIHLATALVLTADYGVPLTAFHTFDDGKSKGPCGKSVPLLSYQTWCEGCRDEPAVSRVIALTRAKPEHPNPNLPMEMPSSVKAGPAALPAPPDPEHPVDALPKDTKVAAVPDLGAETEEDIAPPEYQPDVVDGEATPDTERAFLTANSTAEDMASYSPPDMHLPDPGL